MKKLFLSSLILSSCIFLVGCTAPQSNQGLGIINQQAPSPLLPTSQRLGERPETSDAPQNTNIAHQQLTQIAPRELQEELRTYMKNLKGMSTGATKISLQGTRAVFTPDPTAPSVVTDERLQIHPSSDGSLHISLPNKERTTYIETLGRGEVHPRNPTTAMIYGPRTQEDLDAIKKIIVAVYQLHTIQ